MLNIKEAPIPVSKSKSRVNQYVDPLPEVDAARMLDIQQILVMMEVGQCAEMELDNPNAWYVAFQNQKRKLKTEKQFTRRKGNALGDKTNPKIYTVWRIK